MLRQLYDRFTAATPRFWRTVQQVAGALLAAVVALQAAGAGVPPWLLPHLPTAFTVLTTVVAVAQFTCSDPPAPADQPAS